MELFLTKKVGDTELSMSIEFDAKTCEDCAQAAFHATSFFGGEYGAIKTPVRDIALYDIKNAFEKFRNVPFPEQPENNT